jgi:hypothetical protein
MTQKKYRELIEYRVAFINKKLGTKYHADYCSVYGGWSMYEIDPESGAPYRNCLGFDCRKSNAEMLNYVDGNFELLCHYEVTPKK